MLRDLDTRDSTILKGLAISAIVLHNFFHLVSIAQQNEFTFGPGRFHLFLRAVRDPALSIQAFFSFFGHFGVQVFIFLSAYGLAKSHWDDPDSWVTFMWGRISKLYPLFGLIVIPWMFAAAALLGPVHFIRQFGLELLLMFSGLFPFFRYGLPPIGPWWFISFIVQFYAIWPFMRRLTSRFGWPVLVLLATAGVTLTWISPTLAHWNVSLLQTPFARMPVLCFGIFAARYPFRISFPVAAVALAVLLLGSEYRLLWPFTFLSALLVVLWAYMALRVPLRRYDFLVRLGEYSLIVFLVNAIVRNLLIRFAISPGSQLLWGFISAVVSFGIAAAILEPLRPNREPVIETIASEAVEYSA